MIPRYLIFVCLFVLSGLRDPKQQKYHTAHLIHEVKVICVFCWSGSKSAQIKAPLSHRKKLLLNASSAVQPLIPPLCDITLRHVVTHFHNLCLAASLSLLMLLGQACVSWPIRAWLGIQGGVLKETGAQTEKIIYIDQNTIVNVKISTMCAALLLFLMVQ